MPAPIILHVTIASVSGSSAHVSYELKGAPAGVSVASGKGGLANKIVISNRVSGDVELRFMLQEPRWKFVTAGDHTFDKGSPGGADDSGAFRNRSIDGPRKVFSCVHTISAGDSWWHSFKVTDGSAVLDVDPEIENED